MKAAEFEQALRGEGYSPGTFCAYARQLRDYLNRAADQTTGWRGRLVRLIAPGAAQGIRDVVAFLDEFLARNCGRRA